MTINKKECKIIAYKKERNGYYMKIAVIGSFLIAILHSILFYGQKLGISVFLFCLALGFFLIYILDKNNKIKNQKALLLYLPILLISATYFIFNNSFFYIANIVSIIILYTLMLVLAVFDKTTMGLIINKVMYLILGPIEFLEEAIGNIIEVISNLFKKKEVSKEKKKNYIRFFNNNTNIDNCTNIAFKCR